MSKQSKKITVTLSFPDYKWEALTISLEEKGSLPELEIECFLEKLYQKKVSTDVRKYLAGKYKEYEQTQLEDAKPEKSEPEIEAPDGGSL